jgi:GNAT superfamily N-acetyltransferase
MPSPVAGNAARGPWTRDGYTIDTDPTRLDRDTLHAWLSRSYWAEAMPRDTFERSLEHALNFGLYAPDGATAGFARVVTDRATVAYLGDVFVLESQRGRGLSKWLMACITSHPDLQGLRRWILLTRDAHGLYARYGFTALAKPERWMERWDPDVYRR